MVAASLVITVLAIVQNVTIDWKTKQSQRPLEVVANQREVQVVKIHPAQQTGHAALQLDTRLGGTFAHGLQTDPGQRQTGLIS
jgi:hypothetical protein